MKDGGFWGGWLISPNLSVRAHYRWNNRQRAVREDDGRPGASSRRFQRQPPFGGAWQQRGRGALDPGLMTGEVIWGEWIIGLARGHVENCGVLVAGAYDEAFGCAEAGDGDAGDEGIAGDGNVRGSVSKASPGIARARGWPIPVWLRFPQV